MSCKKKSSASHVWCDLYLFAFVKWKSGRSKKKLLRNIWHCLSLIDGVNCGLRCRACTFLSHSTHSILNSARSAQPEIRFRRKPPCQSQPAEFFLHFSIDFYFLGQEIKQKKFFTSFRSSFWVLQKEKFPNDFELFLKRFFIFKDRKRKFLKLSFWVLLSFCWRARTWKLLDLVWLLRFFKASQRTSSLMLSQSDFR